MAKNKSKTQKWFLALEAGDVTQVREFLENGFNIETFSDGGLTGLMVAAGSQNSELVNLLISSKANISATNPKGRDALSFLIGPNWGHSFNYGESSDFEMCLNILLKHGGRLGLWHWQCLITNHDTSTIELAGELVKTKPTRSTVDQAISYAKKNPHEVNIGDDELKANIQAMFSLGT